MNIFADDERDYLLFGCSSGPPGHSRSRWGAACCTDGLPIQNSDMDTIDIGGHDFAKRKKYRDVLRNPKVAFVVDDLASVDPWRPRGIEIRGEAQVLDSGGSGIRARLRPRDVQDHTQTDRELGASRTDVVEGRTVASGTRRR